MTFTADPAIATEHALTVKQKAEFEARLANSPMDGAHVADYLSMAVDSDMIVGVVEEFFERYGDNARADLADHGAGEFARGIYLTYAINALVALGVGVLNEDEEPAVTDLAIRAWCWAKGYDYATELARAVRVT